MRGRWWVWVCSKCGGVTPPSDLSVHCLKCGRSAGSIYQKSPMVIARGIYWACHECGVGELPPEESARCVACGRTIAEVSAAVLARSGLLHHELVSFPNADPS